MEIYVRFGVVPFRSVASDDVTDRLRETAVKNTLSITGCNAVDDGALLANNAAVESVPLPG